MVDSKNVPTYAKFLFASLSGVGATLVCYPLDLLKTRLQVFGEGKGVRITTIELAKTIIAKEGVRGLYTGLSASVVRQATYTGVRMGSFQVFVDHFSENGKSPSLLIKCACGVVSGAMGGVAGLPPDVSLTRMAADGQAPPERRRNYKNVFNAMGRIAKEEGFLVLFRGFSPTVIRACIVNVSQLVSYTQAKEALLRNDIMQDNAWCHTVCSVISAFVSTVCVLPADIAKTRIQNMAVKEGKPEYRGMLDAWTKIVTKEGFFALWKGFTPLFFRNGPQFIVVFQINEKCMYFYKKYVLESQNIK